MPILAISLNFQSGGSGANNPKTGNANSGNAADGHPNVNKKPMRANAHNGKKFCSFYQMPNGCSRKDCKELHKCNRILADSGKPCLGDHSATRHQNKTHGMVKYQDH